MRTPLDTESDEQRQNRANFIEDLGEGPSHSQRSLVSYTHCKTMRKYHFSLISGRIIMFKYSLYMHLRYVLFMYLLLAWI